MTPTSPRGQDQPATVGSGSLPKPTGDFDFLVGPFDVVNRRLMKPLTGDDTWEEFSATAIARTYFNGSVSVDEMCFPTKGFFGMSLRLFDPVAREWTVYWVNSQTGKLQQPVRGRWAGGISLLFGDDEHGSIPVRASYRWSDVMGQTAHWEQGFSVDSGRTWETNWTMDWSRREEKADTTQLPKVTDDFDFLVGDWSVTHRTLSRPITGDAVWSQSFGTASSMTQFNGGVSIDEFDFQTGGRGLAVRLFDPRARIWSIYWVSSVDGRLQPPVHGGFDRGVGEFYGDDVDNGQPVRVRYIWSAITERSAQWQQAFFY
jgi:hypothetical protein